jgi:hypothetical protein
MTREELAMVSKWRPGTLHIFHSINTIQDNSAFDDQVTHTQRYGIAMLGTATGNQASGNVFSGNVVGGLIDISQ